MADFEGQRLDLERAQRHLEAAQAGASSARRAIEQLEARGRPTDEARRTLQRLEFVIETMSGYRSSVLQRSARVDETARDLPPEANRSTALQTTCRAPILAPFRSSAAAGQPS
jgi:hypothetical protein